MTSEGRSQILWLGTVPIAVGEALGRRRLSVTSTTLGDAVMAPKAGVRAVVVPLEAGLRDILAALFLPVLDSGAALYVALPAEATARVDLETANYAIATVKKALEVQPIETINVWTPEDLAETCRSHDPGRQENLALMLDTAEILAASHQRLLRRAFSEFHRIHIEPVPGGLSGASVWRVEAFDAAEKSCEPFVVKVGERRKIASEIESIRDFVENYVPFPHYAPLVPSRCVVGATDALAVSMFVERALSMDKYVADGSPRLVITALFDGPLRRWRSNRVPAQVRLGDFYIRARVVHDDPSRFRDAFEMALEQRPDVRQPATLIDALKGLPEVPVALVYCHGDLHPGNMFIRRNSIDVVLIDFGRAGQESPSSRDPANLDVALAFNNMEGLPALDENTIRSLYTAPLLPPPANLIVDNRVEAIHHIRMHALGERISEREYQISIACHLLRLSGFRDVAAWRGLAYDLADKLL